jgi:Forkhead domain
LSRWYLVFLLYQWVTCCEAIADCVFVVVNTKTVINDIFVCKLFCSAVNSCPASPNGLSRKQSSMEFPVAAQSIAKPVARRKSTGNNTAKPAYQPSRLVIDEQELATEAGADYGSGEGGRAKPPYSYAQLIVQAIASSHDHQLTLCDIYAYISRRFPYYRPNDKGWQVIQRSSSAALYCKLDV